MYKYSKKTLAMNLVFVILLLFLIFVVDKEWAYNIVLVLVVVLISKDAYKEMFATFELTGDRLIVKSRDKVIKEIKYRNMKYLTITRRNKKWAVIADDNGILFTIKPRIENYEEMIGELISKNKSNKKLEVHDYIKKTYKK